MKKWHKTLMSPLEVHKTFLVCFPVQVLVIISPFTARNTTNSNRLYSIINQVANHVAVHASFNSFAELTRSALRQIQ